MTAIALTNEDLSRREEVTRIGLWTFLANPSAAREGTAMPHLLEAADVEPVLHYLGSLKLPTIP